MSEAGLPHVSVDQAQQTQYEVNSWYESKSRVAPEDAQTSHLQRGSCDLNTNRQLIYLFVSVNRAAAPPAQLAERG